MDCGRPAVTGRHGIMKARRCRLELAYPSRMRGHAGPRRDSGGAPIDSEKAPSTPGPFLRWPGGKRWLVASHPAFLRWRYQRYVEPFLGAGSVFFHLRPPQALLGDLNADLVTAFRGVQADPEGVRLLLEKHQVQHSSDHYYQMRDTTPASLTGQAARIIYLNRTCFNGIYRVNRQGRFNVPIGSRTNVLLPGDDLKATAEVLACAELFETDFEFLTDKAEAGDLLFLDPPYTVQHNQNGFIKYNEKLFSWQDQERLAQAATRAAERGVQVVVTNAAHKPIRALYSTSLFTFRTVSRFSSVSAASGSRKQFEELVITSKRRRSSGGAS